MKLKCVVVKWIAPVVCSGSHRLEESMGNFCSVVHTAGWLVDDCEDHVWITQEFEETGNLIRRSIIIPKSSIIQIIPQLTEIEGDDITTENTRG